MDKRWEQLAAVLVDHSVLLRKGEKVMIAMSEVESYPLTRALYEQCIRRGAYPQVQFLSEELSRSLLKHGTTEQIGWVPEVEAFGMEWADVYFGLRGAHNLSVFWDIEADRLSLLRQAMGKISTLRWEKTRWCLLRVPTLSLAEQAGLDEQTIEDMFFDACLLDWTAASAQWNAWASRLNKGRQVRVIGKETDLSFSVEGRTWQAADGRINMPDGEIATSPVEDSVNGHISFSHPAVLGGRLMERPSLEWKDGVLVGAHSATNNDFFTAVLRRDAGASRVGEFAFGTNPHIHHFSNDILLDEKIAGTVHIAVGRAYPSTGGVNQSAIHWDIVKDLREEGQVYLDGELIFDAGRILL